MALTIKDVTFGTGAPKICVPIMGKNIEALETEAQKAAESAADVVEWRVDHFDEALSVERVVEALARIRRQLKEKLLLFTFRTAEEGGEKAIDLKLYRELYEEVAKSGWADLLDVELEVAEYLGRGFIRCLKNQQVAVILSNHNFKKTPETGELILKVGVMTQFGADIGKIAVMPNKLKDVLRLMYLSQKMRGLNTVPMILISMGDLGKVTRIAGELTESVMTFAALEQASAPGQLSVEEMTGLLAAMHVGSE